MKVSTTIPYLALAMMPVAQAQSQGAVEAIGKMPKCAVCHPWFVFFSWMNTLTLLDELFVACIAALWM